MWPVNGLYTIPDEWIGTQLHGTHYGRDYRTGHDFGAVRPVRKYRFWGYLWL